MTQVLKDKSNRVIGRIKSQGGRLVIFDPSNRKLGTYNPKTDITCDKNNRKIGTGNLLTTLL